MELHRGYTRIGSGLDSEAKATDILSHNFFKLSLVQNMLPLFLEAADVLAWEVRPLALVAESWVLFNDGLAFTRLLLSCLSTRQYHNE